MKSFFAATILSLVLTATGWADEPAHYVKTILFAQDATWDHKAALRAGAWAKNHMERNIEILGFSCPGDKHEGDKDREFMTRAALRSEEVAQALLDQGIGKGRISQRYGGSSEDQACKVQILMK